MVFYPFFTLFLAWLKRGLIRKAVEIGFKVHCMTKLVKIVSFG